MRRHDERALEHKLTESPHTQALGELPADVEALRRALEELRGEGYAAQLVLSPVSRDDTSSLVRHHVIGRESDFALLHRASGLSDRAAAAGVEELVRRRMLHGVDKGFDFTHERIREVVYVGLAAGCLQNRGKIHVAC